MALFCSVIPSYAKCSKVHSCDHACRPFVQMHGERYRGGTSWFVILGLQGGDRDDECRLKITVFVCDRCRTSSFIRRAMSSRPTRRSSRSGTGTPGPTLQPSSPKVFINPYRARSTLVHSLAPPIEPLYCTTQQSCWVCCPFLHLHACQWC
jgi:hypothetical protein